MPIKHKKRLTKRTIIVMSVAILLSILSIIFILLILRSQTPAMLDSPKTDTTESTNNDPIPPASEEQISAGENVKKDTTEKTQNTYEGGSSNVSVEIVDASQYGDIVEIRAYGSNVDPSGECSISFVMGTDTVSRSNIPTSTGPTTTSCLTTQIPVNEFSSSGNWTITVSYLSSGKLYNSASKTISIKVD